MTREEAALNGVVGRKWSGLGAGVTKATRGQSDLKAVHGREVQARPADWREGASAATCYFLFKL